MSTILSTQTARILTSRIHASLNEKSGITDVILNTGNKFAYTITGNQFNVADGLCAIGSRVMEETAQVVINTIPSRYYVVYAQINLSTSSAKIDRTENSGSYLTNYGSDNLLDNLSGVRGMELYRFTTNSSGTIINLQDKRVFTNDLREYMDLTFMPKSGGTFTGAPIWNAQPTAVGHLVNKSYVDTNFQKFKIVNDNGTPVINVLSTQDVYAVFDSYVPGTYRVTISGVATNSSPFTTSNIQGMLYKDLSTLNTWTFLGNTYIDNTLHYCSSLSGVRNGWATDGFRVLKDDGAPSVIVNSTDNVYSIFDSLPKGTYRANINGNATNSPPQTANQVQGWLIKDSSTALQTWNFDGITYVDNKYYRCSSVNGVRNGWATDGFRTLNDDGSFNYYIGATDNVYSIFDSAPTGAHKVWINALATNNTSGSVLTGELKKPFSATNTWNFEGNDYVNNDFWTASSYLGTRSPFTRLQKDRWVQIFDGLAPISQTLTTTIITSATVKPFRVRFYFRSHGVLEFDTRTLESLVWDITLWYTSGADHRYTGTIMPLTTGNFNFTGTTWGSPQQPYIYRIEALFA